MQREGRLISVAVSDADITAAFERLKGNIGRRPPSVTFRQIVIPTTASPTARAAARAKADSLLAQIRAGADFEQLARRESADSASRDRGGDLGWNRREVMVPEFAVVMFTVPPGQVGPVTETQYGFHIIRVDRAKPTEVKARHILIKPVYDTADVARARKLADSVLALWKSGTPYDSLQKRFHDRDEVEGSLDPFPRDSLPESYGTAFQGKPSGAFIDPFPIHDPQRGVPKFVIAQLTEVSEGGEYTLQELRDRIRAQLQQERAFRRLIDLLKQETYVAINLDGVARSRTP
jgi:parvulin-like peptidyl-prolyl isomerase